MIKYTLQYLQISRFQTSGMATEVFMGQTTLHNISDLHEEESSIIKMCIFASQNK